MNPSRSKIRAFNLVCGVYLSTLTVTQCCTASNFWVKTEFGGMSKILFSNAEFSLLRVKLTTQHNLESWSRVIGAVPPFSHARPEPSALLSREKSHIHI
jgi:hypothetical protein